MISEDDDTNPPAPNQHLADMLHQKSGAAHALDSRRHYAFQRSPMESFRDFNARRAEKGLPPIWPPARPKTTDTIQ